MATTRTGIKSDMIEALREEGCRLTPQRLMILSIISDSTGHVTAEAIHERVKEQYPFVDISTVYRTLHLLRKLGLVTEADLGDGVVSYELAELGPHHHLVCRRCGATTKLDDSSLKPLVRSLRSRYGFVASLEHVAIFGLCANCAKTERPTSGEEE
jgi:Fur family ferric uptake transcriptional regulator